VSDILKRMSFTLGSGAILDGDSHERAVAHKQFDEARTEITTLRQQLADMQAIAYYYPPTAPFALDGVTWKQRAEEAERKVDAYRQALDSVEKVRVLLGGKPTIEDTK